MFFLKINVCVTLLQIDVVKLEFKQKAQSKVNSYDNIEYTPGGGDKPVEINILNIHIFSKLYFTYITMFFWLNLFFSLKLIFELCIKFVGTRFYHDSITVSMINSIAFLQ